MPRIGLFECSDKLWKVAEVIDISEKDKMSIKSAIYSDKFKQGLKERSQKFKSLLSTVFKVVEHRAICDELIERADLKTINGKEWPSLNLARVLVFTLLWGRQSDLGADSEAIRVLKSKRGLLKELLAQCKNKIPQGPSRDLKCFKFIRVNTIVCSVPEVVSSLETNGMRQIPTPESLESYYNSARGMKENEFVVDYHFSCLLAVISFKKIRLVAQDMFTSGVLIIQDKASLLPTTLLDPTRNSTVLDMCAAPGMKTSHLAALMHNTGQIYAVDRDAVRFKSLQNLSKKYGLKKNIRPILGDILGITCLQKDSIEYILLDAPCSGSGMVGRAGENNYSKDRLGKLKTLQRKMLKFALSNFKNAKRVVYSTCSIFPEENEEVVDDVQRLAHAHGFQMADCHKALEGFPPGSGSSIAAPLCISCKPESTLTKGFFVAVFERNTSTKVEVQAQNGKTVSLNNKKRKFSELEEGTYADLKSSPMEDIDQSIDYKVSEADGRKDDELKNGISEDTSQLVHSRRWPQKSVSSKKKRQLCRSNGMLWVVSES